MENSSVGQQVMKKQSRWYCPNYTKCLKTLNLNYLVEEFLFFPQCFRKLRREKSKQSKVTERISGSYKARTLFCKTWCLLHCDHHHWKGNSQCLSKSGEDGMTPLGTCLNCFEGHLKHQFKSPVCSSTGERILQWLHRDWCLWSPLVTFGRGDTLQLSPWATRIKSKHQIFIISTLHSARAGTTCNPNKTGLSRFKIK